MEITYLKSLDKNKLSRIANPEGLTIEKITQLEAEINNGDKFPSYRTIVSCGKQYIFFTKSF